MGSGLALLFGFFAFLGGFLGGFFLGSDPSCQRLTPFLKGKGKSNGIRHQENSEGLHAGF
jgi:hypothetical protein